MAAPFRHIAETHAARRGPAPVGVRAPRYTAVMTVSIAAPPGPKLSLMASLLYRPGLGNPLEFFSDVARTYGDIASYRIAGEQLFFVNDPQLIKDILVTHHRNF